MFNTYKGKTLLIIGGTGSFGTKMLEKMLLTDIAEIRIFSRDEKKQDDMRHAFSDERIKYYIGDIRDAASVENAMRNVSFVFQAAALKQVPTCECYPIEAVKTNIIGTENVINAAVEQGVQNLVCLSTDKAVYPVNAMGMTKAIMEKVAFSKANQYHGSTTICCTRYGNIMCSQGSVIPLFIDQIVQGKEITITDLAMTRFLVDLDEAVELVLYAQMKGENGDLFVHKSPACSIGDLAQALLELFEANNKIKVIGERGGEKQHETLLTKEERCRSLEEGKFIRIPLSIPALNGDKPSITHIEESVESYRSDNTDRLTVSEIKERLLRLPYIQHHLHVRACF